MKLLALMFSLIVMLTACGGGGGGSDAPSESDNTSDDASAVTQPVSVDEERLAQEDSVIQDSQDAPCQSVQAGVNWTALLEEDCPNLADYSLFSDKYDPTINPTSPGQYYQLTAQLFSDYANKYRFIFIPAGESIRYDSAEAFDLPVGSVLVKTFALPQNLSKPDKSTDALIETRLLIHRARGWTALAYQWHNGEALLNVAGAEVPHTLVQNEEALSFEYHIPSRAECKNCHQLTEIDSNGEKISRFTPIGVKARLLNRVVNNTENSVTKSIINQLEMWQAKGILTGLPDVSGIPTAGALDDLSADLADRAKGYIDVNCAHCHRKEGFASISGLRLGFFEDHKTKKYGVCKQPPGYDGGEAGLNYDIVPGDASHSILPYRMSQQGAKDRMPPIGRQLVHDEGVLLVSQWIDSLKEEVTISCD